MLVGVGILFGLIFGWKGIKAIMIKRYLSSMQRPAVTVSTMKVEYSSWQSRLKSVASLRALLGVNVTTELAGMVTTIYYTPGQKVNKGDLLVQLNAGTEIGQLRSLQAQVELAKITFRRDQAQFNVHAVSKQTVDTDEWNLKNLQAQVAQQAATVDKKTIRAPFSGYLGINNANPGQYLNPGDTITVLQSLDPIYADFYLPQQALAQLKLGQVVNIETDTFPGKIFKGKITTIQPIVDTATRNVQVEATLDNPKLKLKPGMFAQAEVDVGDAKEYLTVPQSAISFNPYGDIVFVVKDSGTKDAKKQPVLVVKEVFVTVGDSRGDQVEILKGLQAGDIIVTSGQLKLKNGSSIVINNTIQPSNDAAPKVQEK
ncbi:RND family efflux transporter MFP subunit [Legionella fallonii LLAP-10]|uniref:RND family efflux transporter MFP subunit n=2 Tax=Legionella fallonii TaxID=96230 RepID=A0A098G963_9GAMM|nr:RND family efflux transporter MFP subunit [Legionella fallonii LLAP-10]